MKYKYSPTRYPPSPVPVARKSTQQKPKKRRKRFIAFGGAIVVAASVEREEDIVKSWAAIESEKRGNGEVIESVVVGQWTPPAKDF